MLSTLAAWLKTKNKLIKLVDDQRLLLEKQNNTILALNDAIANLKEQCDAEHNNGVKGIAVLVAYLGGEVNLNKDLLDLIYQSDNVNLEFKRHDDESMTIKLVTEDVEYQEDTEGF